MRWVSLLLCLLLVMCIPVGCTESVVATPDYKARVVNSFETGVDEVTSYGSWDSGVWLPLGGAGSVTRDSSSQYSGYYSARLNATTVGGGFGATAKLNFTWNASVDLFLVDKFSFCYSTNSSGEVYHWYHGPYVDFRQWNGTTELSRMVVDLSVMHAWAEVTFEPEWEPNATHFTLRFTVIAMESGNWVDFNLDYFRVHSGEVNVRLRYWNLYTGLGYYTEKLLARYYTFETGWVDIWQGEFQAYKGDEVLVSVTDVFGRNVWTGIVSVDSVAVYVDIMVPIVTVQIAVPDWYDGSVPMEWRITNLPWGPDGLAGMTLPAIGFEFEVLAGWYNLAWLANGVAAEGSQTFLVEGNATEFRGTMIISDLSIPMDPDYEIVVEGDDGRVFDIKDFDDLVALCAALYEDDRVKAALLISGLLGLLLALYRLNRAATKKAQGFQGGS